MVVHPIVVQLEHRFDRVLGELAQPPLSANTDFKPLTKAWADHYREYSLVKPGAAPFVFTISTYGFTIELPMMPEMIAFDIDDIDGGQWNMDRALTDALTCEIDLEISKRRADLRATAPDGSVRFTRRLYSSFKHLELPQRHHYAPAFPGQ